MSDGAWGFVIGLIAMLVIAPFALRQFAANWKRLRGKSDDVQR